MLSQQVQASLVWLMTWCTFDKRLEAIFKNLLATTAIFDTVEHARAAARQVRYQVRMVTLDGTELRTGWFLRGGCQSSK